MTEEKLKKLEAAFAAAPGGTWTLSEDWRLGELRYAGDPRFHRAPDRILSNDEEAIFINDSGVYSTMEACVFVVEAHAAMPELIAEVRRSRDAVTLAIEEAAKKADAVAQYWLDTGNGVDERHIYAEHGAREAAKEIRKINSTLKDVVPMTRAQAEAQQARTEAALDHPVKPGDVVQVKVGGVAYETVIDPNGVQRFKKNTAVDWLAEGQLNRMAVAYQQKNFTQRDYAEFNMALGYSVSGFADLSAFQDLEIENPLWEKR